MQRKYKGVPSIKHFISEPLLLRLVPSSVGFEGILRAKIATHGQEEKTEIANTISEPNPMA